MKQTTKAKIIIILAILTMIVLGNTEIGAVKLVCWFGLFLQTVALGLVFEKELR